MQHMTVHSTQRRIVYNTETPHRHRRSINFFKKVLGNSIFNRGKVALLLVTSK